MQLLNLLMLQIANASVTEISETTVATCASKNAKNTEKRETCIEKWQGYTDEQSLVDAVNNMTFHSFTLYSPEAIAKSIKKAFKISNKDFKLMVEYLRTLRKTYRTHFTEEGEPKDGTDADKINLECREIIIEIIRDRAELFRHKGDEENKLQTDQEQ